MDVFVDTLGRSLSKMRMYHRSEVTVIYAEEQRGRSPDGVAAKSILPHIF